MTRPPQYPVTVMSVIAVAVVGFAFGYIALVAFVDHLAFLETIR